MFSSFDDQKSTTIKIVYHSEGLLGQIYVLEYPNDIYFGDSTLKGTSSRWLYVNRISQTMDNPAARTEKKEERYFTYVFKLEQATDSLLKQGKNKALLLGLGGGSVAKHFTNLGWQVDACELDQRIAEVAKNYFELPSSVNITVDDARHFINLNKKKYDIIIFDLFKGEEAPSHVLTWESIEKVKLFLNEGGMIFLNCFGYIEGEKGRGMRSVYKTLVGSGFDVQLLPTEPDENQRNLLFICSNGSRVANDTGFIDMSKIDMDDAVLLSDETPCFEIINASAALAWRSMAVKLIRNDPFEGELNLFR